MGSSTNVFDFAEQTMLRCKGMPGNEKISWKKWGSFYELSEISVQRWVTGDVFRR